MKVLHNIMIDTWIVNNSNIARGHDFSKCNGEPSTEYGEVHTGDKWHKAQSHCIGDDTDEFPMPIIVFYDKTHTDNKDDLLNSPLLATFNFLNLNGRKKTNASMHLGLVPNQKFGKSINRTGTVAQGLPDEHDCWRHYFRVWLTIQNQKVNMSRQFNA